MNKKIKLKWVFFTLIILMLGCIYMLIKIT
jgi:hypothetical protein